MTKKLPIILFLSGILPILVAGQAEKPVCGTDAYYQEKVEENPQIKKIEKAVNKKIKKGNFQGKRPTGDKLIIPIVFHIMYDDKESNVSKERVLETLETLNRDFQKKNADTADVRPVFSDRIAELDIEFRLAQVDPDGNRTNGINRVQTSLTNNAGDNVKDLVQWDPDSYLNVWSVANISRGGSGQVSAYANFPWMGRDDDGIVVLSSNLEYDDRTMTHEVGHYLGLFHPFQGGCTSQNDRVDDTPPIEQRNGIQRCNNVNTCDYTSNPAGKDFPDMETNYMDYTTCGAAFTEGQKSRMLSFLPPANNRYAREALVSEANLAETGVKDETQSPEIESIETEKKYVFPCEKVEIGYKLKFGDNGLQSGTADKIKWDIPEGFLTDPKSKSPKVSFNKPGEYTVKLTLINDQGKDQVEKKSLIQVLDEDKEIQKSYFESFEEKKFRKRGLIIKPNLTGNQWQTTQKASNFGNASLYLNNFDFENDQSSVFRLPKLDLSATDDRVLKFDMAYAKKKTSTFDELKIEVSSDCGETWVPKERYRAALDLPTHDPKDSEFYPQSEDDWETKSVELTKQKNLMVRFNFESNRPGNNIFIDNVRMNKKVEDQQEPTGQEGLAGSEEQRFKIYPNPVTANKIRIQGDNPSDALGIQVTDMAGKQLMKKDNIGIADNQPIVFEKADLNISGNGVYYLHFSSEEQTITKKIVVIE